MLKLHTSDGLTSRIDLENEAQARELLGRLKDPLYQAAVSGLSLSRSYASRNRCPGCGKACRVVCKECARGGGQERGEIGVQYSVSRPQGFSRVFYHAEAVEQDDEVGLKGGERLVVFADDTRLTVMVHRSQPSVRVVLSKTGVQRYNPLVER